MDRSNFAVSRWLLVVEASVCLVPASVVWTFAMLNMSQLIKAPLIVVSMLLTMIAPINLWLAIRFVATQRPLHHRMHILSALLFTVYALLQMAGIYDETQWPSFAWFPFDWGLVTLLAILPALCCWHLSLLATGKLTMDKPVTPVAA